MKLSAIGITNLSGKSGGSIFSHNQGGAYVKNFAVPTNPNTVAQQDARSRFGSMASLYASLSAQAKDEWKLATPLFPRNNRLGDSTTLSAMALFVSLNGNLESVNIDAKTAAPVPTPPQVINGLNLDFKADPTDVAAEMSISGSTFDSNDNPTLVVFYASRPLPINSNSKGVSYRYVGAAPVTANAYSDDILNAYEDIYGKLEAGNRIFVKAQTLSSTTGEKSASSYRSIEVTAVA